MIIAIPRLIGDNRQIVGNTHLGEHAPQDLSASISSQRIVEGVNLLHLRQELVRTIDRTREDGGEESDIGCKLRQVPAGLDMLAVDLDDIADELEGEEADTDRQNDVQRAP